MFPSTMHYRAAVPSQLHEVLVVSFRNRPELAPLLLEEALNVKLPVYTDLRVSKGDVQTAVNIAQVAAAAATGLASHQQALYLDFIESALSEAARKAFEMLPEAYQFIRKRSMDQDTSDRDNSTH